MENRYKIKYDLKTKTVFSIRFKQGDTDSAILEVSLTDNGLPVIIEGETIEFRFLKPDHTIVFQDMANGVNILDAINGKVECIMKTNTLAYPGVVGCEIYRSKDGKDLTTPLFNFTVERSIGEDGLLSTNYISSIEDKLIEMNTLLDQFENTNVVTLQNQLDINTTQLADMPIQSFITEKEKTIDVNIKLGLKTDKVYSDINLALKRDKSLKLNATVDFDDETKAQLTGVTPITYSPVQLDGSVTPTKTSFFKIGKNLFNKNTVVIGFFVIETTGVLSPNGTYNTSDFIKILPSTAYTRSGADGRIAYYDINKVYISGTQSGGLTQTSPANAYYVRYTFFSAISTMQFELGSVATIYEAYYQVIPKEIVEDKPFDATKIPNLGLTYNKTDFITLGKNLFNKSTVSVGYFVAFNTGLLSVNAPYSASDYIPVLPNTQYIRSYDHQVAFYDAEKVYISGNNNTVTGAFITPSNCVFLRTTTANTLIDTYQLELGSAITAYEVYCYKIPKLFNVVTTNWLNKIFSSLGDSITAQNTWQPAIASKFGLTLNNYGVGGSTVGDIDGTVTTAMCRDERINLIASNSDIVTFLGGTNDWAQNIPIGVISDTATNTFYGAIKMVAQKLITRFPTKRIIFMATPFGKYPSRAGWSDTYGLINNLGLTTQAYGKVIIEVSKLYGIPYIDVFGEAGWNDINIATYVNFDGAYLHPNIEGGKRISSLVIGKMKAIEPVS